jgi:hypothetical protein
MRVWRSSLHRVTYWWNASGGPGGQRLLVNRSTVPQELSESVWSLSAGARTRPEANVAYRVNQPDSFLRFARLQVKVHEYRRQQETRSPPNSVLIFGGAVNSCLPVSKFQPVA